MQVEPPSSEAVDMEEFFGVSTFKPLLAVVLSGSSGEERRNQIPIFLAVLLLAFFRLPMALNQAGPFLHLWRWGQPLLGQTLAP